MRSRFHPLQLLRCGAERRLPIMRGSISKPCIKARMQRFCPRKWSRQNAGITTGFIASFCRISVSPPRNCGCCSSGRHPTSRKRKVESRGLLLLRQMSQPLYNAAKVLLVPDWISREEEHRRLACCPDAHSLSSILNLFLYFKPFLSLIVQWEALDSAQNTTASA